MMETRNRKVVAAKIISYIPSNQKTVPYLMDRFNLSRESVYRRMRGDIPFSFDEIVSLSVDLGFSLNDLVDDATDSTISFTLPAGTHTPPEETYLRMMEMIYLPLINNPDYYPVELIITLNKLTAMLYPKHLHLLRFFYYEWMHQTQDMPFDFRYANVRLPDAVVELCNNIPRDRLQKTTTTFITEHDMVINTMRKVEYFFRRGLITLEEFTDIKEDLADIIDQIERYISQGVMMNGGELNFYLSLFDIPQNSIYVDAGNQITTFFWIDAANIVSTTNPRLCQLHKRWVESLKKYASYITKSNQVLQADFFEKQRKYLNSITE
ncbi:MAG: hypothetical protein LBM06_08720 [Prevotellaceae bacterium]|jgi:hypothetical protein|nr:hypothetical protein [Prevotellaceae bacterium]